MTEHDIHEGLIRVISQLTAAITNTSLYSATHPQVRSYVDQAYGFLIGLLQRSPEITILLIGGDLIADNRPLASGAGASSVTHFARILKKKAIERLTFVCGLPKSELQTLIRGPRFPGNSIRPFYLLPETGKGGIKGQKRRASNGTPRRFPRGPPGPAFLKRERTR